MRKALLMIAGSIISVQVGAAFAKSAFPLTTALGMAWLRFVCAGLILMLVARPHLRGRSRQAWLALAGYCLALAAMNVTIYQAMARIPLGMAVTIEFLGPLTVGLISRQGRKDLSWVCLAGIGVALLGWSPGSLTWAGVAFALMAAACWGSYILITPVVGRHWPGAQAVTVANIVGAAVLVLPVMLTTGASFGQPRIWLIGLAVGLLSSVFPYILELAALRRIERRIFSILMSLEPAVAALAGLIILHERLGLSEWLAMACVIVASIGVTRTGATSPSPDEPLTNDDRPVKEE